MATAEQIINVDINKKLIFNKENLQKILLKDEIKDLPVVIISIVGTTRQGKSFLLNFFLRFLTLTCKEKKNAEDWLNKDHGNLSGFVWKKSLKRETIGIVMWSEIFISRLPSGEEVGIILLDTQGTFDNQASGREYGNIFTLASLLSSVQIYNLLNNVKLNDLMYLEFFLKYGQLIKQQNPKVKPFQNILFLIRDWLNPDEHPFGEKGGRDYLNQELDTTQDNSEDNKELKNFLKESFNVLDGFLLPGPGSKVIDNATADLNEIDEKFLNFIKELVSSVLRNDNLVVKRVNGTKITATALYQLIEKYCESLNQQGTTLDLIYKATVEVQNSSVVEHCTKLYEDLMSAAINANSDILNDVSLHRTHWQSQNAATEEFKKMKKMGDDDTVKKFSDKLNEILEQKFQQYEHINTKKINEENRRKEEFEWKRRQAEEREKLNELLLVCLEQQLASWENEFKDKEKKKEEGKAQRNPS